MFIYVIVCNESLKLYIGQHKKNDLQKYFAQKWYDAHRYSGKRSHLYAALRKYPRDSWSIHPLVSGIETKAELDELEKHFIKVLKAQNSDIGYNICDGGEGFTGPHTEEWKRQTGERTRQWHISLTPAERMARNATLKKALNKPRTEKQIAALARNRPKHTPWLNHGRQPGFKHSEETLNKMRNSAAGRVLTAEHRQKLREAHKGVKWSAARRAAHENKTFSLIREDKKAINTEEF